MGKIFASCGHEISDIPKLPIATKETIQNGVHMIMWKVLCEECIARYRERGLLLETVKDQEDWVHGGTINTPDRYR